MILRPEIGCWLGNVILLSFELFFLRQARRDARLFDTDFYFVVYGNFLEKWKSIRLKTSKTLVKEIVERLLDFSVNQREKSKNGQSK